ncbi:hypothetical protein E2562_001821 [Oryza meyeriana var. granulata]|uniref:Uncharacterized protein n=1 Tax=Oryza meyeriana var. granulata TaxID=110450 RepID=A0A6G1CDE9_9ORYZ|nr:hypothetical protein E2562_001821 [Oryza meyeriana var. granulata]
MSSLFTTNTKEAEQPVAQDLFRRTASENRCKNHGAYIVLHPPNFSNPKFHCFDAVKPRPTQAAPLQLLRCASKLNIAFEQFEGLAAIVFSERSGLKSSR